MANEHAQFSRKALWRRLDVEGLDACSFSSSDDGYLISGTALYMQSQEPARFEYRVFCNADWSSRSAWVGGWLGSQNKEFSLSRDPAGHWQVNGTSIAEVSGLLDIDLGFTPATNTNAIKRLGLAVGEEIETSAVWLDVNEWRFKALRQVYRRLSETEYLYVSPDHDYVATLVTDDFGIVRQYPQLWELVSGPSVGEP